MRQGLKDHANYETECVLASAIKYDYSSRHAQDRPVIRRSLAEVLACR